MNPDPNQTPPPIPATDEPLQFDKVETAGEPLLACAVCKTPISSEYYQANGQTICPNCRARVASVGVGGSGAVRFLKAAAAGLAGGIAGFVIYYFVTKITGWNIGLIAIVVGWLVGTGVRWGSEGRGGLLYQVLAAGLTWASACAALYLPDGLESLGGPVTIGKFIVVAIVSMAAPFLEGFTNIIGWVILGFAVYQAWIMNRKVNIEVSGPFFTRQATPPAAP
jgi:hypothetical protein